MNILLKKTICVSLLIASIVILASCFENTYEVIIEYDSNKGVVTGSGEYEDGEEVTISAKANEEYTFSHWEENGQKVGSTSPTISFHLTENREFKAVFEKIPKHHVIITSNYKDYGAVNELNKNLAEDKRITLKATPEDGYEFEGWFLNGKKISSKEHDQVIIKEASEIVGKFTKIKTYSLKVETNVEEFRHLVNSDEKNNYKKGERVSLGLDLHQIMEEGIYEDFLNHKFLGFYKENELVSDKSDYDFNIYEDTTIELKFKKSKPNFINISESFNKNDTNCVSTPKEFDIIKTSEDKTKIVGISDNTAYILLTENYKCIASYDISDLVVEHFSERDINWLDNSDGFYISRYHNSEGYGTLKVFYLDSRIVTIETTQDFLFNTFFRDLQSKDSSLAFGLATGYGAVYTFVVGVVNLDTLEVNIQKIFNYTWTETPGVHSGIVLSDNGDKLFYNYNDAQIWNVNEDNIFTGVFDLNDEEHYKYDVTFEYLENPKESTTETKCNRTHGTPKYWLNENQVLSLLDEGSMYIVYEPFFAHLYIFDTVSEETIFVESNLNSVYDIKRIDNSNNLEKNDSYITGSRKSDKTIYYLTTIKNELKKMTSVYASEIFSKRDLKYIIEDSESYRRQFIEYFPKKYDKYVESSNYELFSLPGNYQHIEEAIYMKDGTILIVIRNEKYKAKDKKLVLIDSDRDANVIYENSKGFVLIDCFEDVIKMAAPNDSGKYELVSIDY